MNGNDEVDEEPLYRVFRVADGMLAYLPVPGVPGVPLAEAERLSRGLAVATEVRQVWPVPEDAAA